MEQASRRALRVEAGEECGPPRARGTRRRPPLPRPSSRCGTACPQVQRVKKTLFTLDWLSSCVCGLPVADPEHVGARSRHLAAGEHLRERVGGGSGRGEFGGGDEARRWRSWWPAMCVVTQVWWRQAWWQARNTCQQPQVPRGGVRRTYMSVSVKWVTPATVKARPSGIGSTAGAFATKASRRERRVAKAAVPATTPALMPANASRCVDTSRLETNREGSGLGGRSVSSQAGLAVRHGAVSCSWRAGLLSGRPEWKLADAAKGMHTRKKAVADGGIYTCNVCAQRTGRARAALSSFELFCLTLVGG